jgi:hypothetical protein
MRTLRSIGAVPASAAAFGVVGADAAAVCDSKSASSIVNTFAADGFGYEESTME